MSIAKAAIGDTNSAATIHTLWVGSPLGPSECLCLTSWLNQGYLVNLHAYEPMAAPQGVTLFDASLLCPRSKIFRDQRTGSLTTFSDYYRALILRAMEGTWLDTDIFLLRPIPSDDRNLLTREGADEHCRVNNSLMRLSPDHPILDEIINRYDNPWRGLPKRQFRKTWPILVRAARSRGLHASLLQWGALGYCAIEDEIGKHGFNGAILSHEQSVTAHKADLFAPIDNAEAILGDPAIYVHLYKSQVSADLAHPIPGSIYARLWERLGFRYDNAPA